MISFNQYCYDNWGPTPKVMFGIHNRDLYEEFKEISDYMFHFSNQPKSFGAWSYHGDGIHEIRNPVDDNEYEHVDGTKFKNIESAMVYGTAKKKRYLKNLNAEHEELGKHHQYSDQQKFAIQTYTDDSTRLNEALLHNKELNMSQHSTIKHLEDVLLNKKTHKDLIVYSGTSHEHANKLRMHDVVEHPSYLSTSIDASKAYSFAKNKNGDMIKIHVPAGHSAAYIAHISNHPGERELLLPKGLKLKIHKDKQQYHNGPSGSIIVHHATIEKE